MSLHDLFNPKSIALIGASRDPNSAGHGILQSLIEGGVKKSKFCVPFEGKVFPINPHAEILLGQKCYKSIQEINEPIDIAIIAVPELIVEQQVKLCIKKKVKGVIIVSAGFSETGEEGKKMQERIALLLKKHNIDLVGPNCLGILRTSTHLNASFAPSMPPQGTIAFISQSGALADSIIDWSIEERYGFSSIASVGNQADKDVSDFLEYFGKDPETLVITLYIEGLKDGRKFLKIAKEVSRHKPIIAIKAGKTSRGKKAVSSHTGSLAGDYAVYQAAFKQAGVILAESVEEMFDIAKAFACQPIPKENAIAIVTNGGGPGVLCADYCTENGVGLVKFDNSLIRELEKSKKMHTTFSRANPLDIVGDALADRYQAAIDIVLSKREVAGMIVIQTLQTMTESVENAKVIINAHKRFPEKPILCTYVGGKFSKAGSNYLEQHKIPDYNDVRKSAMVMAALVSRISKKK